MLIVFGAAGLYSGSRGAWAQTEGDGTSPDAVVMAMDTVLRLRAAPSTESAILGLLDPQTGLSVIGRTEDSRWLAVRTPDGRVGWVWSVYVTINIDLATVCAVGVEGFLAACAGFDAGVALHVLEIYTQGQVRGNRPNVFAKVGDSITVNPSFLYPFGEGLYQLGAYPELQRVIDHYGQGDILGGNPFVRASAAAGIGWTAAAMFDSANTENSADCLSGEMPLDCEYRVTQPSVALIMFGTNDVGYMSPDVYRYNLDRIVSLSIERGIIPILSTIPPREDFDEAVSLFNTIVAEVAVAQQIPLWDYYNAMTLLPERGLTFDGVHPSQGPLGVEGVGNFAAPNLNYGYVVRNLTALQMLDAVLQVVQ